MEGGQWQPSARCQETTRRLLQRWREDAAAPVSATAATPAVVVEPETAADKAAFRKRAAGKEKLYRQIKFHDW